MARSDRQAGRHRAWVPGGQQVKPLGGRSPLNALREATCHLPARVIPVPVAVDPADYRRGLEELIWNLRPHPDHLPALLSH